MKKRLFVCITILLVLSSACESVETPSTPSPSNTSNNSVENATVSKDVDSSQASTSSEPESETNESIIPINPSEYCSGERMNLDSETKRSFYGTWKVEKLLGFANSYNDASEFPKGQKVIDDEFIIKKDFFSSKGLKNYTDYQYELKNPIYYIDYICYNSTSFYRLFKTDPDVLQINLNDKVKWITIRGSRGSSAEHGVPLSFFIVNNERLILLMEATNFELKKVTE